MGKKQSHKHSSKQTPREIKKQKKTLLKNAALGLLTKPTSSKCNQNITIPNLHKQKTKIISDLMQKRTTSSRQSLIDTLKQKLSQNNPSQYKSEYFYASDSTSNQHLYDPSHDTALLDNITAQSLEKKLNEHNKDNSHKAYMKILNSVIETADVVLEILDARDPLNCRSIDIENLIVKTKCKKLILILNKIDLIPLDNAIQWQNYLKQEHTTLLFKANTQNQGSNLSQSTLFNKNIQQHKEYVDTILQGNKAVGSEEIINVLKNYARNQNIKTKLTVGVIGYPNVGKSSIINSLKRGKVVGVSSTPGFTKGIQEVVLDGDIKLIDCPGVVFSKNENNLLQNVIRIEDIKEPINAVISILKKVSVDYLVQTYELDVAVLKGVDVSSEKLLYLIGDKMKKYKKGGSVDLDKAARLLIADWNSGKLKYHTTPPNYGDGGMNLDD